MAGKKGNSAHANSTSYPNQKRNDKNPSVIMRKLNEIRQNALDDSNILCWQDACLSIGWRVTKMDYWCSKIPTFGTIKKEVQNIVVSRINKGALESDFQPTASIWRMKQLGETDEKVIDNKSSDGTMSPQPLAPETAKAIAKNFDDNI